VILLALGAMLVSCKAEVGTPADELVSVSFEMGSSRALSATLEEFDKTEFYWYYAAVKTDGTGLISGQTVAYDCLEAVPVDKTGKGLGGQIPGFSQGIWSFKLFAYFERPTNETERAAFIYSGEATDVVLQKNSETGNKVTVIVGPNPTGDGFLFIDKEHIYLEEASTASHNKVSPVIGIEVIQGGTPVIQPETNVVYKAPTGTYRVTVAYTDGFITYATGMVIATVYPGLTTTVSGYVDELVTYAQFDAVENPDIVRETWGSTITNNTATTGNISLVQDATSSTTEKVASATMPAKAAVDKMNELATNVGADAGTSSMKLNLNVDTTEATETKVKYDIGMEAELTYQKNGQASTSKSDVKNIDDYVIVVINLASDITDVSVTHSGEAMIKYTDYAAFLAATVDNDALINPLDPSEGYKGFYCLRTVDDTKTLNIKTRSFSPFEVTYTMSDYVAVMDGVKYSSLDAAIAAVPTNGTLKTITLLRSISDVSGITIKNRNVILDLAGKTITMKAKKSIDVDASTVTFTGNGIINVDPARLNGAIGVHNNSTFSFLSGKLVVTNTTCPTGKVPAAYGIFLYNQETVNLGSKDTDGPTIECVGPCLTTNGGCQGGTFNVYSGSYTSTRGSGDGDSNVIQIANTADVGNNTVNIYGGTFTQTGEPEDGLSNIFELRYPGKKIINIEGGVFNCNGAFFYDEHDRPNCAATDYVFTGAVAYMNGHVYNSLQTAIDAAPVTTESSILVLRDVADGSGLITEGTANAKYLTIDFGGHTYVVKGPAVGSKNTATQAMHWGDGSRITLKNGKIEVAEWAENVKMGMQNYSALTIEDMTIDVSKVPYAVYPEGYGEYSGMPIASFNTNRGSLTLKNSTVTVNSENGDYGCNVGNSSLQLYGSQIVGAGVVLDEEGAMVVTWDAVSTTSLTDHVKMYFPGDETHEIGESIKEDVHLWILVPVNSDEGIIGAAWPVEEGEEF